MLHAVTSPPCSRSCGVQAGRRNWPNFRFSDSCAAQAVFPVTLQGGRKKDRQGRYAQHHCKGFSMGPCDGPKYESGGSLLKLVSGVYIGILEHEA